MADINDLSRLVLVLVMIGLILGIGILVLSKFGGAVAESTVVTDETVTISSGAGRLANADQGVTAVTTTVTNATDGSDTLTISTANWTSSGVISLGHQAGGWNFSYVYDKNVTATDTSSNTIIALAPVASDWLPLIVTVAVLAIILGLVLSSFAVKTR